jgi:hypothetical protein
MEILDEGARQASRKAEETMRELKLRTGLLRKKINDPTSF